MNIEAERAMIEIIYIAALCGAAPVLLVAGVVDTWRKNRHGD